MVKSVKRLLITNFYELIYLISEKHQSNLKVYTHHDFLPRFLSAISEELNHYSQIIIAVISIKRSKWRLNSSRMPSNLAFRSIIQFILFFILIQVNYSISYSFSGLIRSKKINSYFLLHQIKNDSPNLMNSTHQSNLAPPFPSK